MESKGDTAFALELNFLKKLTIISIVIETMVALTQNLPKEFKKDWSRAWILKSSRNQFKIIKETYFSQDKLNENVCS